MCDKTKMSTEEVIAAYLRLFFGGTAENRSE